MDPPGLLAALLACSAEGDEEAFARLYDATSRRVFGLARRILSDPADAEEATLDAYAAIWRNARRFDPTKGRPMAWILQVTRSKAIDALRARRRRPTASWQTDAVFAIEDLAPTPEVRTSVGERCAQMRRALQRLPQDQRAVIELAYLRGMSQREVSEQLDEPLGTVKSRMRLGISALRRTLEEGEK